MPRTLLMDLDGTLVDTVPDLGAALNRLMRDRKLPEFNQDQVASMVGDGVPALVAKAFAALGRDPDATAVADMSADYAAHVAVESRLFPGVLTALTELHAAGWCLAVCTNKPVQAAWTLLDALGVLPLLRAVGGGDSFPVRKPDPKHLLATLAEAAATPREAVMLGDHRNDMLAASGAALPAIYAAWGYGSPGMEAGSAAVAADFAEAVAIAGRLLR